MDTLTLDYLPSGVNGQCGIYRIVNTRNGKFYVGSTKNAPTRKKKHFNELKRNAHGNEYLQNAWNAEEDKAVFEFQMFIYCKESELIALEQSCFDVMKPVYNFSIIAGGGKVWKTHPMLGRTGPNNPSFGRESAFKGKKHSADSRTKMGRIGEAHNRVKLTEQQVREIRASDESYRALAKRFSVSAASICKIKNKETWSHVT